ncbi:hypothetical protein Dsin_022160 [Dipteronia sinensis]|uniref:Uncharacterized protein n=1 Tax=Dipteronia sinensis TaxID=43782 RepID=A0AAE0DZG5_9ROSI|nr:hypothetical protein Dsin_022160 [Dipteronia sinensis]
MDIPMNPSNYLDAAYQVAGSAYEYGSSWGENVGCLYGSTVEDNLLGSPFTTKRWRSGYCNPDPPGMRLLFGMRSISTQVVRNRMKSIKNIQKITKEMKMVAASKLRSIQVRTENSRCLWEPFTALLGDTPSVDIKKNVIVMISSDKGLCGGINSTSVKISKAIYKLNSGPDKQNKYVFLGEKANAQLIRDSKDIEVSITELQKHPLNYTQVSWVMLWYEERIIVYVLCFYFLHLLPRFFFGFGFYVSLERESESGGKVGDLDSYEIKGGGDT